MPRKISHKPEGMARIQKFDAKLKRKYVTALAKCGLLAKTAHSIGVSHYTIESHRKEDAEFKAATEQALALYRDSVEQEVHDRAIEGWQEPIVYQGRIAQNADGTLATVLKKSDRLLELLAKAKCPEFRDRFDGEITVKGGVLVVGAALTEAQWSEQFGGRRQVTNEAAPFSSGSANDDHPND